MLAQIGPYFIDEELATGGMARVFKGRLRGLGGFEKTLVIKQVRPELAQDPAFLAMFVKEANTLVSLSHPHIVPVYELFSANGSYFLSMEYVEGATVAQLLVHGPLPATTVAHVGAQICDALDYAHRSFGLQHRDVTPRNVIVDSAGHARLLDFGIAGVGTSVDEHVLGSPGYAAPEQVLGEPLSDATDLFTLGALLVEALSGVPVFPNEPRGTLAPVAPDVLAALPESLRALCTRLLARDPRQRPTSAREVGRTLRAFLAAEAPHGVLEAVQHAVAEARASRTPSSPRSDAPTEHAPPVPTRSLATNPVLTQILRTAGGSPVPRPPSAPTAEGLPPPAFGPPALGDDTPGTRKIRDRTSFAPPRAAPPRRRAAWLFALLVATGGVAYLTWPRTPHAPPAVANPPRPTAPPPREEPSDALLAPAPVVVEPTRAVDPGTRGAASATITINASPWAEVRVDGRPQGTTPLRNLRLKAGQRRVELVCPPLGTRSELVLEVSQGERGRLMVELDKDPPRTFLDGLRQVR